MAASAVLADIIKLEESTAEKLKEVQTEINKGAQQLRADREKLYKRRQELVTGKALPTQEELKEWQDAGGAHHEDGGSSIKGVPYFYLTVLCNQDTLAEEISSRDKQALSYCTAVRATYPSKGGPPTLEFSFSANPFFTNSLLKRCLGSDEVAEVTTDIQWKDTAHKLTVKEVTKRSGKKGKAKGGKGKGKGASGSSEEEPAVAAKAKYKACSSFFTFFMPDTSSSSGSGSKQEVPPSVLPFTPEDDEDDEAGGDEKSEKQERDEMIMALLLEEVLPKATTLYMAGPLQAPSDEDEEDSDFQVVHGPVGDSAADLPPATQKVLAALRHNQGQLDAAAEQWQQARTKLKAQQSKLKAQLAQERRALLLPKGASETQVPRFWLRVLKSADAAALAISPRDAAVLAALADVRFSLDSISGASELQGKWELEFLPNPYLVAADGAADGRPLLVKSYTFEQGAGSDRLLQSKVVAAPKWADPSRDPTLRVGKDGKQRPASSIFQLFKAGGGKYAFNLLGSSKDVQDEANDLETELLQELFTHLLLEAGQVYQQRQDDDDSPKEDAAAWDAAANAEADSDEEELETDEEEDEGEAAHAAAVKRSKQRRSWKPSKSEVLILLVAMMLLGELFVMIDMLWRK